MVRPLDEIPPEPKWESHGINITIGDGKGKLNYIIDHKTGEKVIDPGEWTCPKGWQLRTAMDMGQFLSRACFPVTTVGSE